MPYKERYRKRKRRSRDLSLDQRTDLLWGFSLGANPWSSDSERKKTWLRNRRGILSWFRENLPGRRPSAWWDYDAPEPRHLLSGHVGLTSHGFHFGIDEEFVPYEGPVSYESEASYLRDRDLLFPGEKEKIESWEYEPDVILSEREVLRSTDDFYFNFRLADRPRAFAEAFLRLTKGRRTSGPLKLLPYQKQIVWEIFGWLREETGLRRFRKAAIWIPKKNAKSFIASSLALYMAVADGESGAEVYCASGNIEQAGIVFREAKKMVSVSEDLSSLCEILRDEIRVPATHSFLKPLSSKAETKEGIDASTKILDEVHIMDRSLADALDYADISRAQPLTVMISTAGIVENESFGYSEYRYGKGIVEGTIDDPSYYVFIREAQKHEIENGGWRDLELWARVNPGFGITTTVESAEDAIRKAENSPSELNKLLRYRLNVWVNDVSAFFDMERYRRCVLERDLGLLEGYECYAGIDLSACRDLTALVLVFPPQYDLDKYHVVPFFWIPSCDVYEKSRSDGAPYDYWIEREWVFVSGTEVIPHKEVVDHLLSLAERFRIVEVPFDRALAARIVPEIEDAGLLPVEFAQSRMKMSQPIKDLRDLIVSQRISFQENDCLKWNFSNAVVDSDQNENVMLHKRKSTGRIDGVVATVMALARALASENEPSVTYESGDLLL